MSEDTDPNYEIKVEKAIAEVAIQTPKVNHWLPTKEYSIYTKYSSLNTEPTNLIVRVSAPMIDGKPSKAFKNTSTVHKNNKAIGFECKARNACGPCRACWDKKVENVSYRKH